MNLQNLIDRQDIADLFSRYVDALDYKNWPALNDMFVEAATASWFANQWSQSGRAEIVPFIRSWVETVKTHHMLGNHTAEIAGDQAQASCRVRAHHAGVGDKADLFEETLGVFSARLVRTAEGWKFTHFQEELLVMLGTFDVFDQR